MNNDFIDGKELEIYHKLPKWLQQKFSNHKGLSKYWISIKCFRMLSLLYIMNGGKWGPNWKYEIGTEGIKLKDLKDECKYGWNFMVNIEEPIYLIHDCVGLSSQIKRQLAPECCPKNKYVWTQYMLYWSNRCHEYKTLHPNSTMQKACQ